MHTIISCSRSGLQLCKVELLCGSAWPLVHSIERDILHPYYGRSLEFLLTRLNEQLMVAANDGWNCEEHRKQDLQVLCSAVMYNMGAMWLPSEGSSHTIEPSVPLWSVVTGSGRRLAIIAGWWHYATSKRMKLPKYRITTTAGNVGWENFGAWLDAAFDVKQAWEKGNSELRTEAALQELNDLRDSATEEIRAEHLYKKLDFRKIWNWVDVQLESSGKYAVGRRETFKTLFLKGDLDPELWSIDDIEDLQFAITECCDIGNDITFYINTRLNDIKALVVDFFSSFTIVGQSVNGVTPQQTKAEIEKEGQFFATFDKLANTLLALPPEPSKKDYPSLGLYLKAKAEWNILSARFARQQQQPPQQPPANNNND